MADEISTPAAPKHLPAAKQDEWKKAYAAAFKKAQSDYPDQIAVQSQFALREANRLLQVPEVKDYAGAMALPEYLVLQREVIEGVLCVITADGKKYKFAVPAKPAAPPAR
jgi:hypothetical protein